jgi:methionine synthase II (cobalamin-independent)
MTAEKHTYDTAFPPPGYPKWIVTAGERRAYDAGRRDAAEPVAEAIGLAIVRRLVQRAIDACGAYVEVDEIIAECGSPQVAIEQVVESLAEYNSDRSAEILEYLGGRADGT